MSTLNRSLFSLLLLSLLGGCGGAEENNPRNPDGEGPASVHLGASDLGAAGGYVILAKTGISNETGSTITGDLGLSPAAASFLTGFALVADPTNVFATSSSVVGRLYAADYASPSPSNLTSAIGSMETAYTDAAGRTHPDHLELAGGALGGLTLEPGLYKWTSGINIATDVTLSGSGTDVWILQTTGDLTLAAAKQVILAGGAKAKNVFWQVAGQATFGANSRFEGIVLSKTSITLQTGATLNGRALAQSQVAVQQAIVTQPD